MAGERRWSDRNARPSPCGIIVLVGFAGLLAGLLTMVHLVQVML